eukprot:TRINITY_DN3050_c0_g2_i1.p1 TRINITY_DN3050_c0_g2~~TRINITY_DN3050_c0_g2_i1.p1  ORF type:complete len:243 (+),score=54.41 TRINITY_DN3050_c0_g2_i1:55-783(+)
MMKLFCVMVVMVSCSFAGGLKQSCTTQTVSAEGSSADATLTPEVAAMKFHANKHGGGKWYVTMKVMGVNADAVEKIVAGSDDVLNSLLESVNKELKSKYTKLTASKGMEEGEVDFDLSAEGMSNGEFLTEVEGGHHKLKNKDEMRKGLLFGLAALNGEGPSAEEPPESTSVTGVEVVAKEESTDDEGVKARKDGQPDSNDGPAPAPAGGDAPKGSKQGGKSSSVRNGISAVIVAASLTQLLM